MKTLFSYLNHLVIWIFPFIGLNLYLSACYNQSLFELSLWWVDNISFTVAVFIKLITFVILFLLFSIQLTSLINTFNLVVFGRRQSVVFLGNLAKNTAMLYRPKDKKKKVFFERDSENEFIYSFNDVNLLKTFIKLPFTNNTKVISQQNMHPYAILNRIMLALFFAMPTLAAIHALALPAYVPDQVRGLILSDDAIVSFDQILSAFNFNIFTSAVVFFFSLLLANYFSSKLQQVDPFKHVQPLPEYISEKSIVTGKPLIISKTYIEKFDSTSNSSTQIDTGFRRISFEFAQGFNPPVYVTLRLDGKKHPGLEQQIKLNIKAKKSMYLELTGKLRLKVMEEEEQSVQKAA